jgi:hypothetical protein
MEIKLELVKVTKNFFRYAVTGECLGSVYVPKEETVSPPKHLTLKLTQGEQHHGEKEIEVPSTDY